MTNFKTSRKNYIIGQRLKARQAKGLPSLPETFFNEYQVSRGLGLIWDESGKKTLPFKDLDTGKVYDFQLDFLRPNPIPTDDWPGKYDIDIEIQGERFHRKASKENWKCELKNNAGLRVILIPATMAFKRFWPDLDDLLPAAFSSDKKVIDLDEYA